VLGTRQTYEQITVIDPLSAAAIAALAGNGFGRQEIEQTLRYYDYSKINLCGFFLAEVAYYALPQYDSGANTVEGFVRGMFIVKGFILPYRYIHQQLKKVNVSLILQFHGAGSWKMTTHTNWTGFACVRMHIRFHFGSHKPFAHEMG
jgi:hypothetical protein